MKLKNRLFAILLTISMVFVMIPQPSFAVSVEDALDQTIQNYYLDDQNGVLTDWKELATVYAAEEDLTAYSLPSTVTGTNSTTVMVALMKGDMETAEDYAKKMVSGTTLISGQNCFENSLNLIAIEAYNRSASLSGTYALAPYDKNSALSAILKFQESDGGFVLGQGGDPDTTGIALAALSIFRGYSNGDINVDQAINSAKTSLKNTQRPDGGFAGKLSGYNSQSAAVVIWGLIALQENIYSNWNKGGNTPISSMLTFFIDGGGFGVKDTSRLDIAATRDTGLALAQLKSGKSFFTALTCNQVQYKSILMQLIAEDGKYYSRNVTVKSDETLEDAIDRTLGNSSASLDDYNCYVDGELIDAMSFDLDGGKKVLAVHESFTDVAYFKTKPSDELGVNQATINFGESLTLTLVIKELDSTSPEIPMNGFPVDSDGDGYEDGYTDASGKIAVSFISAKTYAITALRGYYAPPDYNYEQLIDDATAILPAEITMNPSGQTNLATVSVRIEGVSENILYNPVLAVGNSGQKQLTVLDAVTQALKDAKVSYKQDAAGYINEIGGIASKTGGIDNDGWGWDGWQYNIIEEKYLNGTEYVSGMKNQPIQTGDEIVVYYGDYTMTTVYPFIETTLNADKSVTIQIDAWQNDENWVTYYAPVKGVTVLWAENTSNEYIGVTSGDGIVIIPAEKARAGTYTLQLHKTDDYGLPSIVRLAPGYTVTVTNSGASGSNPAPPAIKEVYITVHAVIKKDTIGLYKKTAIPWFEGMTALDLLLSTGLDCNVNSDEAYGKYISSIKGYAELGYGPNSGWLCKINNKGIMQSSAKEELNPKDNVLWHYTEDYTKELGPVDWNGSDNPTVPLSPFAIVYESNAKTFTDVPDSHWAKSYIYDLLSKRIITGKSDTIFAPNDTITRAEFATILARVSGDALPAASGKFSDVSAGSWYAQYVEWAVRTGVTQGMNALSFAPNHNISREDMATMIMRYAAYKKIMLPQETSGITFADDTQIAAYAKESVTAMQKAGIVSGRGNNKFEPKGTATRAETAKMISEFIRLAAPEVTAPEAKAENAQAVVSAKIKETAQLLMQKVKNPTIGSVGGEWTIIGLARCGEPVSAEYFDGYYNCVLAELKASEGVLHRVKYTEYSRLILALTALGRDVSNVGGYNLLQSLADFDTLTKQGINGPIFALIALDSYDYDIPSASGVSTVTTRQKLIDYILERECKDQQGNKGGFSLGAEEPQIDITGMALQALSKYKDQKAVAEAIDRGVATLQRLEKEPSSQSLWNESTVESAAQTIVAKAALGLDPSENVNELMKYAASGGGFSHDGSKSFDLMATEQAFYALVAYDRYLSGKNAIYDMSDVTKMGVYEYEEK